MKNSLLLELEYNFKLLYF
uniref:Uncharacterized protein n=1 Tax=Rhizophora mucronata TaxID=61149 RepID=A0A2P2P9C0_RHIMU